MRRGFRAIAFTIGAKRLHVWKGAPSRLSQMAHNGLNLGTQEGVATTVIAHRLELGTEGRTARNPSAKGLDCGIGRVLGQVKQGKFGLAIGTWLKHVVGID